MGEEHRARQRRWARGARRCRRSSIRAVALEDAVRARGIRQRRAKWGSTPLLEPAHAVAACALWTRCFSARSRALHRGNATARHRAVPRRHAIRHPRRARWHDRSRAELCSALELSSPVSGPGPGRCVSTQHHGPRRVHLEFPRPGGGLVSVESQHVRSRGDGPVRHGRCPPPSPSTATAVTMTWLADSRSGRRADWPAMLDPALI
jgi:hypothetical protein